MQNNEPFKVIRLSSPVTPTEVAQLIQRAEEKDKEVSIEKPPLNGLVEIDGDNSPLNPLIPTSIGTGSGLFLFFVFYIFTSVGVYGKDEDGNYVLLGRALVRKKKGGYTIKMQNRILQKADTSSLQLRFHKSFVKRKLNQDVQILFKDKNINTKINHTFSFSV